MKKRKFVTSVLCAAVLALGLISCNEEYVEGSEEEVEDVVGNEEEDDDDDDDDWIWDFWPIEIFMAIQDAEGNNMLDPANPDSIVAEFRGESFVADTASHWRNATRAIMPTMYGLRYMKLKDSTDVLYFGEIDGAKHWVDEPLTIKWPDGTTDVITISSSIKNGTTANPIIERSYKLNGKEVEKDISNPIIRIVK
jgi:hypothetical protein